MDKGATLKRDEYVDTRIACRIISPNLIYFDSAKKVAIPIMEGISFSKMYLRQGSLLINLN